MAGSHVRCGDHQHLHTYTQYAGGPELQDRTLALKLFAGKHQTRTYPTKEELEDFGQRICGVSQPALTLERIAQAMHDTMKKTAGDERVSNSLRMKMAEAWEWGYGYAK